MASYRLQRTNEDILRELTALLRELKDPRVAEAMLTVVKTDTDSDLSTCKVYVSSLRGLAAAKEAVAVLRRAGFLRRELGQRRRLLRHEEHAPAACKALRDHIGDRLAFAGAGRAD